MSALHRLVGILALTTGTAGAAAPSEADWAHCAAIDAAESRLACYDALYRRVPGKPAAASAANAPAATPASAPAAAPVPFDPKNFGFTPQQTHAFDSGPASINVRITRIDADQQGRTVILLDNDQTWLVSENDGRLSSGDSVRIKHASLGAFILVTSSNHTYHVRRLH